MAKQITKEESTIDDLPTIDECFIITPIGDINSDIYIKANGLIDSVIQPVLDEYRFKAVAAHHINKSGSINNQILKHIMEDKLVIVNLTGLNPNVMYELAVRHAIRKPVIIMCEKAITPRLPFDISDQRTIFYSDSLAGNVIAKEQLKAMIDVVKDEEKPDNPIYAAASQEKIFQSLDDDSPLKLIMEKLERLESKYSRQVKDPSEVRMADRAKAREEAFDVFVNNESEKEFEKLCDDLTLQLDKVSIGFGIDSDKIVYNYRFKERILTIRTPPTSTSGRSGLIEFVNTFNPQLSFFGHKVISY